MVTERIEIIVTTRGSTVATNSIRNVGKTSSTAASAVGGLTRALIALGGAFTIKSLIDFADTAIQIENRVRLATGSVEEFTAAQARLQQLSTTTRTALDTNAQLFQRLRVATKDLGASTGEVLDVVEGLNAAIAISGASTQEAGAGLIQLAQGLASGRLQGDELRSVLENMPVLAQRLAAELGVTVGQLRELGAEGKLNAEVLFPALQRATAGFVDELSGIQFTTQQTFQLLRNSIITAVGDLNTIVGASGLLNSVIVQLSQNIRGGIIEGFAVFAEIGAAVFGIIDQIAKSADSLGITVLPSLSQTLTVVGRTFLVFFNGVETGIASLRVGAEAIGLALQGVTLALGLNSQERFNEQLERFNRAQGDLVDSSFRTEASLFSLFDSFSDIAREGVPTANTGLASAAQGLRDLAKDARDAADASTEFNAAALDARSDPVSVPDRADEDAARKAEQERLRALQELLGISRELRLEELDKQGALGRELALIDEQIAQAVELGRLSGEEAFAQQTVNDLIEKRAQLIRDASLGAQIAGQLATDVAGGFSQGISNAIRDGGDVFGALGSAFETNAQESLIAGIEGSLEELQKGLDTAFRAAADAIGPIFGGAFSGVSEGFGAALSGAVGFIANTALSAIFGGGGNSQRSSGSNVRSAVTSSQAVRGIVAGPSQIAIAEVGNSISAGFAPVVSILGEIRDFSARITAIAEGSRAGRLGIDPAALTVATGSAPLAAS